MQFTKVAVLLFATAVSAAPAPASIPKECVKTSDHTLECTYTSPHPGAYPVITTNSKGSCSVDADNAHHIHCKVPEGSMSFDRRSESSSTDLAVRSPAEAEAYKFSLICDDDGCSTNGLKARAVDAEAYKLGITIEFKRDLVAVGGPQGLVMAEKRAVDAEAYKLGITIEW